MAVYRIQRVYVSASPDDGTRILVDRLWPRGLSKAAASVAQWMKELGPSTALRQWFAHDPAKWNTFGQRYRAELAKKTDLLDAVQALAASGVVTLVYGAREERYNHAVVLREVLMESAGTTKRQGARSPLRTSARTTAATARSARSRSRRASGSAGPSRREMRSR